MTIDASVPENPDDGKQTRPVQGEAIHRCKKRSIKNKKR